MIKVWCMPKNMFWFHRFRYPDFTSISDRRGDKVDSLCSKHSWTFYLDYTFFYKNIKTEGSLRLFLVFFQSKNVLNIFLFYKIVLSISNVSLSQTNVLSLSQTFSTGCPKKNFPAIFGMVCQK